MSKKVEMFQCERCGHTFSTEYCAEECEFTHKKEDFANYMFSNGYYCLGIIQAKTGVLYGLPKELHAVDIDTKFEIEYLQGRNGYIYEINHIFDNALEVVNKEDNYRRIVRFDTLIRGMEKKKMKLSKNIEVPRSRKCGDNPWASRWFIKQNSR